LTVPILVKFSSGCIDLEINPLLEQIIAQGAKVCPLKHLLHTGIDPLLASSANEGLPNSS
jgi:hypothetical protein